MALDHRLKTALDESRLLILGAQVLFGFQFEAAFQELYPVIPWDSRYIHLAGLVLLLLSVGLLIAPSLWHQIIYRGSSTRGALRTATGLAGASLLPLTLGLGAAVFVTFELLFGRASGTLAAITLTTIALALLYGLGLVMRGKRDMPMQDRESTTSLKSKIEQMLTEARVIIPGGQALLGFQLIAVLTKAFSELPLAFKYLHCVGLSAVALSVVLLMTPAALHRIGFQGEDSRTFFRIGSRLVVAGPIPLAIGIAADISVVFYKAIESDVAAIAAGAASLALLLALWLAYPFWQRVVPISRTTRA